MVSMAVGMLMGMAVLVAVLMSAAAGALPSWGVLVRVFMGMAMFVAVFMSAAAGSTVRRGSARENVRGNVRVHGCARGRRSIARHGNAHDYAHGNVPAHVRARGRSRTPSWPQLFSAGSSGPCRCLFSSIIMPSGCLFLRLVRINMNKCSYIDDNIDE